MGPPEWVRSTNNVTCCTSSPETSSATKHVLKATAFWQKQNGRGSINAYRIIVNPTSPAWFPVQYSTLQVLSRLARAQKHFRFCESLPCVSVHLNPATAPHVSQHVPANLQAPSHPIVGVIEQRRSTDGKTRPPNGRR